MFPKSRLRLASVLRSSTYCVQSVFTWSPLMAKVLPSITDYTSREISVPCWALDQIHNKKKKIQQSWHLTNRPLLVVWYSMNGMFWCDKYYLEFDYSLAYPWAELNCPYMVMVHLIIFTHFYKLVLHPLHSMLQLMAPLSYLT